MSKDLFINHDISKAPKTGNWSFMCPEIDKGKCTGCGSCVPFCPEATIETITREKDDKSKFKKIAKVDYDFCKGCGVCATICPMKAITMKKK